MIVNSFEIEKSKIDFKHIWKIKEFDVNIVTFAKYDITSNGSIDNPLKCNITLKELIGTEKHKVSPDVQIELSGKVGEMLKGFEVVKHNNTIRVNKIIWL